MRRCWFPAAFVAIQLGSLPSQAQSTLPPLEVPSYVASSIVNAASPKLTALAPNTIATVYGERLSRITKALSLGDIREGAMPISLPQAGVKVVIGNQSAALFFVSPTQINFLVPPSLRPGTHMLRTSLDSWYGPAVPVRVEAQSPALFQADPEFARAVRATDWALLSRDQPAGPGDYLVLYATGLGQTTPSTVTTLIATEAAPVARAAEFRVLLDGTELPRDDVWAGLAVNFCGLYQVNIRLPQAVGNDPEIRIGYPDALSPEGVRLPVRQRPE